MGIIYKSLCDSQEFHTYIIINNNYFHCCMYFIFYFLHTILLGNFRKQIFEDDHLVITNKKAKSTIHVVKISRLQENPQKQQKYLTSKISQYIQ